VECDFWSIGVIAYFMLSGTPPFAGKDDLEIQRNIVTCNFGFDDKKVWSDISENAKDWINRMLEILPDDRQSPDEAISHPWLADVSTNRLSKYKIHPSVMLNLRACNRPSKLHFELLILFTQFLNTEDIQAIRETFLSMDTDDSGSIEIEELRKAYEHLNLLKFNS